MNGRVISALRMRPHVEQPQPREQDTQEPLPDPGGAPSSV